MASAFFLWEPGTLGWTGCYASIFATDQQVCEKGRLSRERAVGNKALLPVDPGG